MTKTHGTLLNISVGSLQNVFNPVLSTVTDKISSLLPTSTTKENSTADSTELPTVNRNEPPRIFEKVSPEVAKVRGGYDIGTLLIKKFNKIPYNSNVISNNEP